MLGIYWLCPSSLIDLLLHVLHLGWILLVKCLFRFVTTLCRSWAATLMMCQRDCNVGED